MSDKYLMESNVLYGRLESSPLNLFALNLLPIIDKYLMESNVFYGRLESPPLNLFAFNPLPSMKRMSLHKKRINSYLTPYLKAMVQIIYYLFLLSTAVQLWYWLVFFRKGIRSSSLRKKEKVALPVSVIVCAKNEANNLRKHLPIILDQAYPNFELIVVNDHSSDDTMAVLAEIASRDSRVRVINMKEHKDYVGKKMALAEGIRAAKNEWLLMTDADCAPISNQWISEMMVGIADKQIGLGYSPYTYKKGFLNAFIRYETLLTGVQYMSHARNGRPYMGVGRNLLYQKSLFLKTGFDSHAHVASGDDDLFISEVATGGNTLVVDSADSVVYSGPQTTWSGWLHQKKRHMRTSTYYNFYTKVFLGFFSISHFFHVLLGVFLLFSDFGTVVALLVCTLRTLIIVLMCAKFRKKFREVNDWYWIPILDFLYPFYYMVFAPYLISTKTQQQQQQQQQSWKQQQQHHE